MIEPPAGDGNALWLGSTTACAVGRPVGGRFCLDGCCANGRGLHSPDHKVGEDRVFLLTFPISIRYYAEIGGKAPEGLPR